MQFRDTMTWTHHFCDKHIFNFWIIINLDRFLEHKFKHEECLLIETLLIKIVHWFKFVWCVALYFLFGHDVKNIKVIQCDSLDIAIRGKKNHKEKTEFFFFKSLSHLY